MKTSQFIATLLSNLGVIGMGLGMWDTKAGLGTWFTGFVLCVYAVYLFHKGANR